MACVTTVITWILVFFVTNRRKKGVKLCIILMRGPKGYIHI